MKCYSAIKRNTFESVLMRWMNLEPIIQSEVSQKQKDKYRILMHIYRIQKNSIEEFIFRAAMEKQTQREQTYGHKERGGEGEMYGESNIETYITICKIDSQWKFAVGSGNSHRGSVSTQMGRMRWEMGGRIEREGINVYLCLFHVEVGQKKTTKFFKAIILQLNITIFFLKEEKLEKKKLIQ